MLLIKLLDNTYKAIKSIHGFSVVNKGALWKYLAEINSGKGGISGAEGLHCNGSRYNLIMIII